jgi:hypothetical protein
MSIRQVPAAMKVTANHLRRNAYLYVRQSTLRQVLTNTESTHRQNPNLVTQHQQLGEQAGLTPRHPRQPAEHANRSEVDKADDHGCDSPRQSRSSSSHAVRLIWHGTSYRPTRQGRVAAGAETIPSAMARSVATIVVAQSCIAPAASES